MHFIPINYSDPAFNPAFTANFELFVILNENTFSYAVRHPGTQRLVRVSTGHPVAELFEPQSNIGVFSSSYQKVVIAVETNSFCLIPNAVFSPENLPDFASFMLIKEADVILTDRMEDGENTVIFTFPEDIIRKIEVQFQTSEIEFAPKSWIKTVTEAELPRQSLYLFLEENQLQVLFTDQKKIRFYNQFSCSTTDELVYYTALIVNQLKLKPEETTLVISGRVEAESEQILRLKEFFKDITLFTTTNFKQHPVLKQHQIVKFLGLN